MLKWILSLLVVAYLSFTYSSFAPHPIDGLLVFVLTVFLLLPKSKLKQHNFLASFLFAFLMSLVSMDALKPSNVEFDKLMAFKENDAKVSQLFIDRAINVDALGDLKARRMLLEFNVAGYMTRSKGAENTETKND